MKIKTVLERTVVDEVDVRGGVKNDSKSLGSIIDEMLEHHLSRSYDTYEEQAKTITIDVEAFINEVRERRGV